MLCFITDFKIQERGRLEIYDGQRVRGTSTQRCSRKIKLRLVASDETILCEFNMASFRETRELLCTRRAMGFITDAKFLLRYEENKSDNLDFAKVEYPRFSLQDTNETEYKANFRIEKHYITRLEDTLQITAIFKCYQGTVCDGTEGLCILLKRSAYPCRYSDMIPILEGQSRTFC